MENQNNIVHIVVGLAIVGVIAAGIIGYNEGEKNGMQAMHMDMDMMKEPVSEKMDHSQMTMDEMTEGLQGLKGDAFDKAFVEMMIVHHQGAVDMAELIPANAKHEELKKLGRDIISAQTKEIAMMRQWLKDWGYQTDSTQKMKMNMDMQEMDHSMMGH